MRSTTSIGTRYEKHCALKFRLRGYLFVKRQGKSGDMGADIVMRGFLFRKVIVQCKHYKGKVPAPSQMDEDLGSLDVLEKYDDYLWYPAEVDYSLHKGWFYHPLQQPRSLKKLYSAYMRTVGGNGLFLLNVPPDKNGCFASRDVRRLKQLKKKVDKTFKNKLTDRFAKTTADAYIAIPPENSKVRTVVLKEDTDFSQRVESFSLLFFKDGKQVHEYTGTVIGFSKFVRLKKPVACDSVILRIHSHRGQKIHMDAFTLYG